MKYMLLVYGSENAWADQNERENCYEESAQLIRELKETGQYVSASPLKPVESATSVRVREGKKVVTDGPFAETHEQLAGYYIVNVDNLDEAIAIAERIPPAKQGTIEIRPLLEVPVLSQI